MTCGRPSDVRPWMAIGFGLLLLSVAGCGGSQPAPPVADSTMAALLTDLHARAASRELFAEQAATGTDTLLAAHGLDQRRYRDAMRYYLEHPGAYAELYDMVIERLSAARYPPEPAEADTTGATGPTRPAATGGPSP